MLQPSLTAVTPEAGYTLLLEYETGEKRRFDASPYVFGDFYGRLSDLDYFKKARLEYDGWFVGWPEGQDLPSEALYEDSVLVQ